MAAQESDSDEDFGVYGTPLEPLAEGEPVKKPIPIQDQTVKDEKGRYKRFHGAFTGGFSAGYFNTVGSKEGWTPSTFVSSRQGRADKQVFRPEDFMDEEDLGEHGIAPREIITTDDFASKTKDRIKEKAKLLAAVTAPIPGASILEDLIAPAKLSVGVELLRKMGWKEGQGVGPRIKRKPRKQRPAPEAKVYGCALPPQGSEGSEDEEEEYLSDNVTFAPKDVTPIDFTIKDDVRGLGYKGLDPRQALFGMPEDHINLFTNESAEMTNLLGDIGCSKGRKLGISGQAFGVGALEEEDADIYGTDTLSKYDTVIREEDPGDGLFGWTAPKEYRDKQGLEKEVRYVGKILDGFSFASAPSPPSKIYPPPELPRDYRPVHYFRPVLAANHGNSQVLQSLLDSSGVHQSDPAQQSRHGLSSSQRRDLLGETALQGPTSVLELLSEKDRERIQEAKQTMEQQQAKAKQLTQLALSSRFQPEAADHTPDQHQMAGGGVTAAAVSGDFQPFAKNPEKQKRYEDYLGGLKQGEKDALESCLDPGMTEWERGRERDEFTRAAMLYRSSSKTLSSRFTRAKYEDDVEKVDVPRDQEGNVDDKAAAVKMKMFGKLTRDQFEWHPEKLLCKRFNIPDPYPGSTIIGLPTVKRDKYSVFNFLSIPETSPLPTISETKSDKVHPGNNQNKPRKQSRWDVSAEDKKKGSISEFITLARSKTDVEMQQPSTSAERGESNTVEPLAIEAVGESTDHNEGEESRPPMDLFKAIFANSSDEKSSSSEDSEEEEENRTMQTDAKSPEPLAGPTPDTITSDVQEPKTAENELVLPVPPPVMQAQESESEEFGPKLPPLFSSGTHPKPETELSNPAEVPRKQKQKKNRDKPKNKREHKHKKEKKKKHKKHKHKSKHKKKAEENCSSDTADSTDIHSETEETAKLSPQELLKRLKRLPLP